MGKYVDSFGGCQEKIWWKAGLLMEGSYPRTTRCKLVNGHFLTCHAVLPSCAEGSCDEPSNYLCKRLMSL